ncbi:uncharacterized protein OCT59_025873 [Rhizophagus irregularis]|uniref:uncharacterized protein n=1 Tax=Rhizophagus irregularis TaxID=588596 RepID=UPI0033297378|nr:hypothetical protein OCT59_025873 [Rhizophagus irregularis]
MGLINIDIRLVIFLFSIFIAFSYSIFAASLCMTVLFVICRDWFLFCDFYSADEEYEEFKRVFKSSIKHEFASIDDGSKRLIESIEDEIKPLKIKLMYYPILMINQIKMMIFLDFYIPYLKRETSFAIMREMRMEEFRSFLYYVTNIENFFEKIFYSCFISTKIILTSSYASILFVILDSNYLFDLSFLEIGALEILLFSYILLLFCMEFYDFPIKFIYIPSGIIKEGLVVDCNECLENLTKNTEDDNDENKWCQSCQTNYFVKNFKNWTSENVKIDDYIRQKQLEKINDPKYTTFEWILHYDFGKTEKMENYDESCTLYSSIWRDGPLYYDFNKKIYRRKSNRKVVIKVIKSTNSLSATEFIKEIKKYSTKTRTYQGNILEMFGISQDPNTKNYIMVLKYAEGGDLNNWMTNYYKDIEWREK